MPEQSKYIIRWNDRKFTADNFRDEFEGTRNLFDAPLRAVLGQIKNQFAPNRPVFSLGIGTGQIEYMMGIDPAVLTGFDLNRSFLDRAAERLPGATFIHGDMTRDLKTAPVTGTVFSCDALDCVEPAKLEKIFGILRNKSDRLVIAQTFLPSNEFYHLKFPFTDGSYDGPGFEGLPAPLTDAVNARLKKMSITSDPNNNKLQLLGEVENAVMKIYGGEKLAIPLEEIIRMCGLDPAKTYVQNIPGHPYFDRPYISRVLLNLEMVRQTIRKKWDSEYPAEPNRNMYQMARYNKVRAAYNVVELMSNTLIIQAYFAVLEASLRSAGFKKIKTEIVYASGNKISDRQNVISNLNRSVNSMKDETVSITALNTQEYIGRTSNGVYFTGAPLAFPAPVDNSYRDAAITYINVE